MRAFSLTARFVVGKNAGHDALFYLFRYSTTSPWLWRKTAACQNFRDKLVVSLVADTGLQLSELASLRVGDIEMEESSIAVRDKGAKQRKVCVGPFTRMRLEQHLGAHRPTERPLGLKPRGVVQVLAGLKPLTGIKCNAHSSRRTFTTESVSNGVYLDSDIGQNPCSFCPILTPCNIPCFGAFGGKVCPQPVTIGDRCYT